MKSNLQPLSLVRPLLKVTLKVSKVTNDTHVGIQITLYTGHLYIKASCVCVVPVQMHTGFIQFQPMFSLCADVV